MTSHSDLSLQIPELPVKHSVKQDFSGRHCDESSFSLMNLDFSMHFLIIQKIQNTYSSLKEVDRIKD